MNILMIWKNALDNLKPCPFCGGEPVVTETDFSVNMVNCNNCSSKAYKDDWNNRPMLDEALETLKFYADESNWSEQSTRDYGVVECLFNGGNKAVHDGYKKAQQALSDLSVEGEQ
jgi:hypothetical protein